jgi:Leucine rich repeat
MWLQDDPIALSSGRSTRTVLQRYVLAVLCFSTSGPLWKIDYLSRNDACAWNNGFAPSAEAGKLHGVYCNEDDEDNGGGTIYRLDLPSNQLVGRIPWEIVLLTNLARVNVDFNTLTGSLPTRIHELTRLESFWAYDNRLTGIVPPLFSTWTRSIDFDDNQLTGPIPDRWGTMMPGLTIVALSGNLFTGTLPGIFGTMVNLTYLDVSKNLLTGTVPSADLSQSTSLEELSLSFNSLTGSLDEICSGSSASAAAAA